MPEQTELEDHLEPCTLCGVPLDSVEVALDGLNLTCCATCYQYVSYYATVQFFSIIDDSKTRVWVLPTQLDGWEQDEYPVVIESDVDLDTVSEGTMSVVELLRTEGEVPDSYSTISFSHLARGKIAHLEPEVVTMTEPAPVDLEPVDLPLVLTQGAVQTLSPEETRDALSTLEQTTSQGKLLDY